MGKLYYGDPDGLSVIPSRIRFFESILGNIDVKKVYWGNPDGESVFVWPDDDTLKIKVFEKGFFCGYEIVYDQTAKINDTQQYWYIYIKTDYREHEILHMLPSISTISATSSFLIGSDKFEVSALNSSYTGTVYGDAEGTYTHIWKIKPQYVRTFFYDTKFNYNIEYVPKADTPAGGVQYIPQNAPIQKQVDLNDGSQVIWVTNVNIYDDQSDTVAKPLYKDMQLQFPKIVQFYLNATVGQLKADGSTFICALNTYPYGLSDYDATSPSQRYFNAELIHNYTEDPDTSQARLVYKISPNKEVPNYTQYANVSLQLFDTSMSIRRYQYLYLKRVKAIKVI